MQYANILLALGGDSGNQVGKYFVTPAEILVLQAIHGDEAVTDVDIIDLDAAKLSDEQKEEYEDRTNAEDLARLRDQYRAARIDDGNGGQLLVMTSLFPGASAKAPENFADLDTLPDQFYKPEAHKTPRKVAKKSTRKADSKDDAAKQDEPKSFE
jgi:hypothetical protein